MSTVRVNKTKNYTVLSNNHFKEKTMSLKAKGLLSLMLSLPDDWNYSIAGLVSLSKDGKDSVMAALNELEKFGYLIRTRLTNDKGQFAGVEYDIYEEPQRDNPSAEKPNSDNENEGNPNAEDQPQLKTKFTKNLKIKDVENKDTKQLLLLLDSSVANNDLRKTYIDYIKMRIDIGSPLTERGLALLIQRCHRMTQGNEKRQIRLLEIAIINNWKNVYHPKEDEVITESFKNLKEFYLED